MPTVYRIEFTLNDGADRADYTTVAEDAEAATESVLYDLDFDFHSPTIDGSRVLGSLDAWTVTALARDAEGRRRWRVFGIASGANMPAEGDVTATQYEEHEYACTCGLRPVDCPHIAAVSYERSEFEFADAQIG